MKKVRHLKNAPIVEALVDLRLAHPVSIGPKAQMELRQAVDESIYPVMHEQRQFEAKFEVAKGTAEGLDLGLRGYQFLSEPKLKVAQFRVDGFSFSQLKPYTDWDSVVTEAMRLWSVFRTVLSPSDVSRIAVRYINQMRFGPDEFEFSDVLEEPMKVPDGVPERVSQYLIKSTHHVQGSSRFVILTQSMQPLPDLGFVFVLDIDAVDKGSFGCEPEQLAKDLGELRDLKNVMFFNTLTNQVIRRFE